MKFFCVFLAICLGIYMLWMLRIDDVEFWFAMKVFACVSPMLLMIPGNPISNMGHCIL